jgi:AraC-like DNA-binding protein
MRTIYCSDTISGDRRKGWRQLIGDVYAHLDIEIPAHPDFFGRICLSALGDLELTEVQADSEFARRTSRHIARDKRDHYLYLLVRSGEINVLQFDRDCTIGPGDYTLLHLNSPYVFRHKGRVDKIAIKIPAAMLQSRADRLSQHCAVPRRGNEGIARLAASYANSLCGESGEIPDDVAYGLSRTTSDLLGLLFSSAEPTVLPDETAVRAALRRRCEAYITAHSTDPNLDPSAVAAALGISVRYLHRCFASNDTSVMEHLRRQRLRRCYADLSDPSCDNLSIAEIAFRSGFRNICHFNEAFKAEFGVTPRELRRGRAPVVS